MNIYIKNMVSHRCKIYVIEVLNKLEIQFLRVELGVINLTDITPIQKEELRSTLKDTGLEIIMDKKTILIEKVKHIIVNMIHYVEDIQNIMFSKYVSKELDYSYTYLSNLFKIVQGITIEQFIILHKIERVKELICYNELNLTQISYKMNYSSVSHLSKQFKKGTGLSPSEYRHLLLKNRIAIEDIGRI